MKFLVLLVTLSLAIDFPGDLTVSNDITCDLFDVKNKLNCDKLTTDTLNAETISTKEIEAERLYVKKLIAQG